MAKTMKAAVVREFGKPLTIDEVPIPVPGPGQIQVAIQASGVCHTDLHAAEGDWPVKPNPPFIPGMKVWGLCLQSVRASNMSRKVIVSVFHGYIRLAAIVVIVLAAGRLCVNLRKIPAIQ